MSADPPDSVEYSLECIRTLLERIAEALEKLSEGDTT